MFDPNKIITVIPKKAFKPLEVTLKATGEKRLIKDYRFNPDIHENAKVVGEDRVGKIQEKPVEITAKDLEPKEEITVITPEERYAFLKSKGWSKLDGPERKNYKELKAKLEPKKS